METTIAIATETAVSPANIPPILSEHHEQLKQIDAEIAKTIEAVVRNDDRTREASAKIIVAGVRMLDICMSEPEAWDAFKEDDDDARNIACKAKGKESREVATVIWRKHRKDISMGRERVSVYGKAITIAYETYWITRECKTPTELLAKLQLLGIKGLLKVGLINKGETKKKKITIAVPDRWTLFLIGPDSTREEVSDELAKPILVKMGRVH